jgi:hypothetical protein
MLNNQEHHPDELQDDQGCTQRSKCPANRETAALARQTSTTTPAEDLDPCVARLLVHLPQVRCHSRQYQTCQPATGHKTTSLAAKAEAPACKCKTATSHHSEV